MLEAWWSSRATTTLQTEWAAAKPHSFGKWS
jgi:hypothetical protein